MKSLIVATRNPHKAREISEILGEDWIVASLDLFPNAPKIIEDGTTFEQNSLKKAEGIARWLVGEGRQELTESGVNLEYVLADDSGIEVDALMGAPGVISAIYAGEPTDDELNNVKLLEDMHDHENRAAQFRCVLALIKFPPKGNATRQYFDGICRGTIAHEAKGANGFGYDPLFIPEGFSISFGELDSETKNTLSHRARAIQRMKFVLDRLEMQKAA